METISSRDVSRPEFVEIVQDILLHAVEQPADAQCCLCELLQLDSISVGACAAPVINGLLPSLKKLPFLCEEAPIHMMSVGEVFTTLWQAICGTNPVEAQMKTLAHLSITSINPSDELQLSRLHRLILDDVLVIFGIQKEVILMCPPLVRIFLRILQTGLVASYEHYTMRLYSTQPPPRGVVESFLELQASTVAQMLLEFCESKDGLVTDSLKYIRREVGIFLHASFLDNPSLMLDVHMQTYATELIPFTVTEVSSLHTLLDYVVDWFAENDCKRLVFYILLASALVVKYPLTKSKDIGAAAIAVCSSYALARSDAAFFHIETIPAVVRMAIAFPSLTHSALQLLVFLRDSPLVACDQALKEALIRGISDLADGLTGQKGEDARLARRQVQAASMHPMQNKAVSSMEMSMEE